MQGFRRGPGGQHVPHGIPAHGPVVHEQRHESADGRFVSMSRYERGENGNSHFVSMSRYVLPETKKSLSQRRNQMLIGATVCGVGMRCVTSG